MNCHQVAPKYSPESVKSTFAEPGRTLLSSLDAGWSSLLVQVVRSPGTVESFETIATPDQLIVLVLEGTYDIESTSPRSSSKARYRPGFGGMTAAMNTSRLRWSSTTHKTLRTLHLYLPQIYFQEAAEEYRRVGQATHLSFPDALGFADPVVFSVAQALAEATQNGAPDLYAETGARFLASHLLRNTSSSGYALRRHKVTPELTDRRLLRVLEFMRHHFTEPVTLAELAREAAISHFHFARLFKARVGVSPGSYLIQLRMEHAKGLLENTDFAVFEIAVACGYLHAGHFASAFRKCYSQTPSSYRASRQT